MLNALWIVILGMAIIFAVLGVLLLIMTFLDRLIRPKEEEKVIEEAVPAAVEDALARRKKLAILAAASMMAFADKKPLVIRSISKVATPLRSGWSMTAKSEMFASEPEEGAYR